MTTSTAIAALVGALSLTAVPALAQDGHADHADHGQAAAGDPQTHDADAHADHHADFTSGRFHIRLSGREGAPDLILVPGLSSSPHVFDALTEALGDRYRIHALHVQGFAGAPPMDNAEGPVAAPVAEDLARYIEEKGLQRPAVIGHSMGGTIAMMLAARHPDAVGKLMVVDMVPFMGAMFAQPGTNPTVEAVTPIAEQMFAQMSTSTRADYQAQANASINGMINTEALRAPAIRDSETSDQQVSSAAFRELIVTDLRPELPGITAPTEVLYVKFNYPGSTDAATDGIYQMSFTGLPNVELKRIHDSAHFIMYDQPAVFQAEVERFLAE